MADLSPGHRLSRYVQFLAIAAVILFLRLLPFAPVEHRIPGPDLTVAFTYAWLLRRPDFVPAPLIVLVFLTDDLMFWRPVGLWTLLMLLGTEFLRNRVRVDRHLPFAMEMALVAGVTLTQVLANRLLLGLTLTEQPGLGPELLSWLSTMASYPLVVLLSWLAFGLHRPLPGETASWRGF